MTIQVLRDPRRYVLAAMAVALILVVPLVFAFITTMDSAFGAGSSAGSTVLWALIGVACACLLAGVVVILARATRQSELEHRTPDDGAHREP